MVHETDTITGISSDKAFCDSAQRLVPVAPAPRFFADEVSCRCFNSGKDADGKPYICPLRLYCTGSGLVTSAPVHVEGNHGVNKQPATFRPRINALAILNRTS